MRKDIDHLRPMLQKQLERAVETLRDEFAEALQGIVKSVCGARLVDGQGVENA